MHSTKTSADYFPIPLLVLMAFVPLIAIISELMPSGILPQMSQSLGVSLDQAGWIVGIYAISAATLTIPIVLKTTHWNRKTHLLITLSLFATSTFGVGFTTNLYIMLAWRVLGGLCAGVLWSTIAAYGMRLVSEELSGTATALIMAGTPVGLSLGIPILTTLGLRLHWSISFHALGVFIVVLIALGWFFLPSVPGDEPENQLSFLTVLKKPEVGLINIITMFTVVAHYSVFIYIVNLIETIEFSSSIETAQVLFGIGSIAAVFVNLLLIDSHFKELLITTIGVSGLSLLVFVLVEQSMVQNVNFIVWGMTFSSATTIFLTAMARQFEHGKDVAIALFESVFNVSIMLASSIGGFLLMTFNMTWVILIALINLSIAFVLTVIKRDIF